MANFTVTTTAVHDKALGYLVDNGLAPSPDAVVQRVVTQGLNDVVNSVREKQGGDLQSAYVNADPTTQAQVRALLGVSKV